MISELKEKQNKKIPTFPNRKLSLPTSLHCYGTIMEQTFNLQLYVHTTGCKKQEQKEKIQIAASEILVVLR